MNLKSFSFNNLDENTKKMIKIALIVLGVFIAIIILFAVMSGGSSKLSDKQLSNQVLRAAKNYMKDHEELANDVYGVIELTDSELSSNGYMKPIEKLKGKKTTCRAVAFVRYNDKHYSYSVQLTNCDEDYPTNSLSEELVKESNIVSDGAGLYYDSEYDEYYFRGEYINNYVSINGDIWRVLKVDKDRNIKLIENATELRSSWDNRYNSVMIGKTGINIFEGVANSRIKDALLNEYNTNPFYTDAVKSIIIPTSYCYGSRSITNNEKNEEEECRYKTEIMPLAALSVADFYRVSLDYNCNKFTSSSCSNYNYLSKLEMTWTMTAVGENSYESYAIEGTAKALYSSYNSYVLPVATIAGDVHFTSGDGSESKPYILDIEG